MCKHCRILSPFPEVCYTTFYCNYSVSASMRTEPSPQCLLCGQTGKKKKKKCSDILNSLRNAVLHCIDNYKNTAYCGSLFVRIVLLCSQSPQARRMCVKGHLHAPLTVVSTGDSHKLSKTQRVTPLLLYNQIKAKVDIRKERECYHTGSQTLSFFYPYFSSLHNDLCKLNKACLSNSNPAREEIIFKTAIYI